MKKISFKRKRNGKEADWGVGLDYLFKEYWDDLDKLVEDNYYERHNTKLIYFLFPKIQLALREAVVKMRSVDEWVKKAKKIQHFGETSKTFAGKVVYIDTVTQFLRETSVKNKGTRPITKKKLISERKQLKGLVAWRGFKKVQGIARVVKSEKDFKKFKKEEILVTAETDANFLPLMQKAKAIITDKGGILCHAAIVAREMKKPCIIGTQIATQVLKTGDMIKVDAENGIVHIIEKTRRD